MPRQSNRLTARFVSTIKKPGRHADGGNLYLSVSRTGAKSWTFFYKLDGRQREMGLGPARDVTLAEARDLAAMHRRTLLSGVDPLRARAVSVKKSRTFGEVASQFMDDQEKSWRNEAHRRQWRQTLEDYASAIWIMPIEQVATEHVLEAVRPIWQSMPETARRLRGRIERVLDAATAQHMRTGENPARWKGHLAAVLPRVEKLQRGHHPAMPYADVPSFYAELCKREAPAARALRFLILTVARSGEVRGMSAAEIDRGAGLWSVPAARMKGKKPHRVPLPAAAIDLLDDLPAEPSALVFVGPKGGEMSDMVFGALLKRMGHGDVTAHGFRSSFRDWVHAETAFPGELAEEALAHQVGSETERAYRRGDALAKRRALMDAWALFVTSAARGSKNCDAAGAAVSHSLTDMRRDRPTGRQAERHPSTSPRTSQVQRVRAK